MKKITILIALAFISIQSNAQVLLSEGFDTALNWTVSPAGTSWTRVTSGVNPNCTPQAGAGMARFNSYDIESGTFRLTSPAITFGGLFYKANFSVYRDAAYGSSADNIKVYFSTTGTMAGAVLLTTINRATILEPVEENVGWHNYTAYIPFGVTGNGYLIMSGTSGYGNNMFLDSISVEQVNTLSDAQLDTVNVNTVITAGNYDVTGTLRNIGSNPITSIDLNWQVSGGEIHTQSLSGLNILPGAVYTYTHSEQWAATTGQYELTVSATNANGGDSNDENDTVIKSGYVVNEIFPKTVVYEEATGTWCGWCVRGHIGLKDMSHYHDDGSWIGIAVHNDDPMELAAYDAAIAQFIGGYPSGAINRMPSEVDPGLSSLEPAYQTELSKVPLAKMAVANQAWDPLTRVLSFDAQAIFALDINNANYKVSAVIVENGVTGTTASWRQRNYYTGNTITDWEGINWGAYPAYIPAATMVYNHVGRALLGGFTGVAGSIPTSVAYNTSYGYTFTHTLPAGQNPANIEIVAMLLDTATGQIVNATEVELDTTLATASFTANKYGVYPNPTTGIFNINAERPVNVTVIDVLGKVVHQASNVTRDTPINLSGLQKGVYMAKITGDNASSTEKIILN